MQIIRNKESKKFQGVSMTRDQFQALDEDYMGLCVACDDIADTCEPDAEKYLCESCSKNAVYGFSQLLIMGRVVITESSEQ